MCDEAVIVRKQGTIFLGGPPLVKAATGEVVDAETLGGGDVHTRISGVADHLADDDAHAVAIARDIVAHLNFQPRPWLQQQTAAEPLYNPEDIYGLVPQDTRYSYDVHEIIARIEGQDIVAALEAARANEAQARAQLAQAQSDLARAEELEKRGVFSAVDLENARTKANTLAAAANAAAANTKLAAANVENLNVRAPFEGTVLRKDAEVGEIVAPSSAGGGLTRTAIVTMADLATLEVEVDVNEAYIAQIRGAQPSRITLDAYPDTSFAGRVRQVVPTADRQKATVQVKVSILDRDPRILPEMGAKVLFVRGGDDASSAATPRHVSVPAAALVRGGGTVLVWVVENGRVVSRPVDAGSEHGGTVEIRSGLSGGESVVLRPPAGLRDGARVRVSNS